MILFHVPVFVFKRFMEQCNTQIQYTVVHAQLRKIYVKFLLLNVRDTFPKGLKVKH